MVCGCVVLSEIVRKVVGSTVPGNVKLGCLVAEPVVAHVPGFRSFLGDVVVDKASGSGIISFDCGRRLRMAKLVEHITKRNCHLCIVEDTRCFCFRGRGYDMVKSFAFYQERPIYDVRERIKLKVTSNPTSGFRSNKICSIRVNCKGLCFPPCSTCLQESQIHCVRCSCVG